MRSSFAALTLAALPLVAACSPPLARVRPSVHPEFAGVARDTLTMAPVDLVLDAADPKHRAQQSVAAATRATHRAVPLLDAAIASAVGRRGYRMQRTATTLPDDDRNRLFALGADAVRERAPIDVASATPLQPNALPGEVTLYVGGYAYLHRDLPFRDRVAINVAAGIGLAISVFALAVVSNVSEPVPSAALPNAWAQAEAMRCYVAAVDRRMDRAGIVEAHPNTNYLALSATLIENKTGRLVWSASLAGAVDAVDRYEVGKYIARLLRDLPRARG